MTNKDFIAAQEAKRKYQREYMRRWRKANPERVKESNLNYWLRRSEREAKEAAKQKEVQDHGE